MDTMTKSDLLRTFLEQRGVRVPSRMGWAKISCIGPAHFRGDRNPSASVNLTTGRFRCWSCDLKGDIYDLLQILENLDFATAYRKMGGGRLDVAKSEETWL